MTYFQRLMVLVYLDNILMYSDSVKQHLVQMDLVF